MIDRPALGPNPLANGCRLFAPTLGQPPVPVTKAWPRPLRLGVPQQE